MSSQENLKRLTLDMLPKEHTSLKAACAKMGISMKEFILRSAFEKLKELEDAHLEKEARKTQEAIQSGDEKTISWDKMKERLK